MTTNLSDDRLSLLPSGWASHQAARPNPIPKDNLQFFYRNVQSPVFIKPELISAQSLK